METPSPSFAYLLETDLARKGLSQRELAAKLTERDEQPLTEQAISSWKSRGKVPGKRMARLLEILGPDSEVGKAHALGGLTPPARVESVQYSAREITNLVTEADSILRPQFAGVGAKAPRRLPPDAYFTEDTVRKLLPESLQRNFEKKIQLGALTFRFDYVSENAVVEIKTATGGHMLPNLSRPLFRLTLIDRLFGMGYKKRHYGLIVVGHQPGIERPQIEASLMGLQLVTVDSPEKAAQQIEEWEKTPPEDLFSS